MIFENISREKAGQLINIAKILSISSLPNFSDRFPSLKKLIKSSKNTDDWDFFMTVGGVAMGIMLIEPNLSKRAFNQFTQGLAEYFIKWNPHGAGAFDDLKKFVQRTASLRIEYSTAIGLWVIWNIKHNKPNEDELKGAKAIGNFLFSGLKDWWDAVYKSHDSEVLDKSHKLI
jgi:hypothetical protein